MSDRLPPPEPFRASVNGFGFANRWPHVAPLRFRLGGPVPVELAIGDAANGLCGGMAFAALDLWFAGLPAPRQADLPVEGTPAFRYLVRRQLDSFELGLGPARFYLLGAPWRSDASRSAEVLRRELPRIRRELATGRPVALGPGPRRLGQPGNPDPGPPGRRPRRRGRAATRDTLAIRIYDPNLPGDDSVRLLVGRDAAGVLALDYSGGTPVVAFFRQGHRPRDPLPWR